MGSADLFKKAKQERLRRKRAGRQERKRYLVVCEGRVTEPSYLHDLRRDWQIAASALRIEPGGVDPNSLIDIALGVLREDGDFDRVFCVFDRDEHATYVKARDRIRHLATRKKRPLPIRAIISNPCFELWYLLHYACSTKPWVARRNLTACDCLIAELTRYLPNYDKGRSSYLETRGLIDVACTHAARLMRHHQACGGDGNPSTDIHELVACLRAMR